jgi:uncharacterized protein (DUF58 family)
VNPDYHDILKPEIINSVKGLGLISRVIVEGYLSGLNKSRAVGTGMEFSQYRAYEPGDDLRLLDWKMLARSGRYYIKQSEIDAQITLQCVVDASASMSHQENGLSKMHLAKVILACLSKIAFDQGDAVGLHAINNKTLGTLQAAMDKQHFNRFLHTLIQTKPTGKWPEQLLPDQLHNPREKEMIVVVSDFYENAKEISHLIKKLKTARNEVMVIHLMGAKELAFDYKGQVIFEDWESGQKVKVSTKQAREPYMQAISSSIEAIKDEFLSQGIDYELFKMNTPVEQALQLFLRRRKNLL